jgi:hypothetical protein
MKRLLEIVTRREVPRIGPKDSLEYACGSFELTANKQLIPLGKQLIGSGLCHLVASRGGAGVDDSTYAGKQNVKREAAHHYSLLRTRPRFWSTLSIAMKGLVPKIGFCLAVATLSLAPATAQAYGEGHGEIPNIEERAVHLFTDRLRVDPDATDSDFSSYSAVAPLIYNADLTEAARFHADDMAVNGCFQHESCDGTEFGERLQRYYNGFAIGENIALGSPDAQSVVFEGWLYSPPHRDNMLRADWRELGTGYAPGENAMPLWVQDFGSRGNEVIPQRNRTFAFILRSTIQMVSPRPLLSSGAVHL